MQVRVYCGHNSKDISTVGMNNLLMVKDNRITTAQGLARKLKEIITKWHPHKKGNHFVIIDNDTDKQIGRGFHSLNGGFVSVNLDYPPSKTTVNSVTSS